jgi:FAD-dependent sensor of blue light
VNGDEEETMIKSLFYVSEKTRPWPDDGPDVEAITAVALSRNAALGVTGALISTEGHFAQILEGAADAVDAVMASILRDPRHRRVTVLDETERPVRWFAGWSLAFAGAPSSLSALIEPFLANPPSDAAEIDWLLQMMRALARPD